MTFHQLIDFKDESEALHELLASLTDEDFQRNTQFKDWTIHDVIAHLHIFRNALTESASFMLAGRPVTDPLPCCGR